MRYRKLPQDLRLKVQEYYEHRFRKKFFNEESILKELSKGLKEVCKINVYRMELFEFHVHIISLSNLLSLTFHTELLS